MDRRIMLNEDDSHFYYTRNAFESLCEEDIRAFIRQYADTQVGDFMLTCAGRIADYPSDVREDYLDKYDQKIENGRPVDYTRHPVPRCVHRVFRELGLDFYAICIDELRRAGIRPWLSVRMNDCHDNDAPTSFLHPNFFHDHPEFRRVRHHEPMGYFDRCFDYAVPDVRRMMLDTIEEITRRYDPDGVELDWMREIYCFRIGHEYEGIEIINQFTRDARAILDRAEKRWGHPIQLAARTMRDPQAALDSGFDAVQWAREGLIDTLIPTPRWQTTDSDIPVEMWKRLLAGTDVRLAAGIEILQQASAGNSCGRFFTMLENVNALAAQYLSEGADVVYLFNYMDQPDPEALKRDRAHPDGSSIDPENYLKLLRTVGSRETALRAERRHVKTFADVGPVWRDMAKLAPLPMTVKAGQSGCLRLRVGEIPENATVEVRLGMSGEEADAPVVYVNSEPCPCVRSEAVVPAYTRNPARVYAVENDGGLPPFLVVEMIAGEKDVTVDYAEIQVFVR
ncbi:MAG: hypothetical protein IKS52_13130 [Clostridia bacterium]|nr:hypothetical protein [Clostridia bacterium]